MDADEVYSSLAQALRREREARETLEREAAALRAELDQLRELLVARGGLAEGHNRVLAKAGELARAGVPRKVRLRVYVDKYTVPSPDIDCAARLHLCHARCCAFSFELTRQDLEEGSVRWEVESPYLIRHERDGWCTHLDRASQGCQVYEQRPAACRSFDCRDDPRVWIDFEARVPAPMPPGLKP